MKNETWKIEDLVAATKGKLEQKGSRPLMGVGTDTRDKDLKGKIFFALKGENFDAHEFAGQAVENGASVIVVQKKIPKVSSDASVVVVEDTLQALQDFAAFHRKNWNGKVVGLTGSNGKTTTKEMCNILLSQKFPTYATQGNLNNHIGVPLTLLALREKHKIAIVEMGMNHAGEIAVLTDIAVPDIVIVTNVGRAHTEAFSDGIEGVARAKEELYEHAPLKSVRIYNLDNPITATMRARAPGGCKVMTYSSYAGDVDVSFKEKVLTLDYIEVQGIIGSDPGQVRIPSFGRQQVSNAMAASCVALACGLEAPLIWKGLAKCKTGWGRGQLVELESGALVLFDAYNANPDSSAAAFENFSKVAVRGKKYVLFGDMLELGHNSAKLHEEAGELMSQIGPESVLLIGQFAPDVERGLRHKNYSKNIIKSNDYKETLAREFGAMLETGDIILVKGSRGMKLERFVEQWKPLGPFKK